jgi:hypothetical protein
MGVMTMNDDFLTRFRKPPRRAFAAALHERINGPMRTRNNFALRRATWAAALCVALLAAAAFSPSARAAVAALARQIGGITYIGPDQAADEPSQNSGEVQIVPEEDLSLAEAQAKVPFEIRLPQSMPDGYTMLPTVHVSYFPDIPNNSTSTFVTIAWGQSQDLGGHRIELVIGPPGSWLVDLDHLQDVQVNGQPAGLTRGGWDADTHQWDTSHGGLTLTWTLGNVMYQLRSASLTAEDLSHIAESIP